MTYPVQEIFRNPFIMKDWRDQRHQLINMGTPFEVPDAGGFVADDALAAFSRGKMRSCADIVLITNDNGTSRIPLVFRKEGETFAGFPWVFGGGVGAYADILEFVEKRSERECGIRVKPEVLLGVWITNSEGVVGSTMQPCYAARVPLALVEERFAHDKDHTGSGLYSQDEYELLPREKRHPYIDILVRLAFNCIPNE